MKFKIDKFLFLKLYLVIMIIYNSGYMIMVTENSIGTHLMVPFFLLSIIFLLNLGIPKKLNPSILTLIFLLLLYMLSLIINNELFAYKVYLTSFLLITSAFTITRLISFSKFVRGYVQTLLIISITSLVFYYLIAILGYNFNFPILEHSQNRNYLNAIIYFYPLYTDNLRNQSLFWEPGLFSSFLIIGLIFEIRFKKAKISMFTIIVFLLALITTQSTAGIILLIPVLILFLDKNSSRDNNSTSSLVLLIVTICSFLSYLFYDRILSLLVTANSNIFGKLAAQGEIITARQEVPFINMNLFFDRPLMGHGLNQANSEFSEIASVYNIAAQTSTSTFLMAALGILGVSYTMLWCAALLKLKGFSYISKFAILGVILIIINKEPHQGILITWCLLFYFIKITEWGKKEPLYQTSPIINTTENRVIR